MRTWLGPPIESRTIRCVRVSTIALPICIVTSLSGTTTGAVVSESGALDCASEAGSDSFTILPLGAPARESAKMSLAGLDLASTILSLKSASLCTPSRLIRKCANSPPSPFCTGTTMRSRAFSLPRKISATRGSPSLVPSTSGSLRQSVPSLWK